MNDEYQKHFIEFIKNKKNLVLIATFLFVLGITYVGLNTLEFKDSEIDKIDKIDIKEIDTKEIDTKTSEDWMLDLKDIDFSEEIESFNDMSNFDISQSSDGLMSGKIASIAQSLGSCSIANCGNCKRVAHCEKLKQIVKAGNDVSNRFLGIEQKLRKYPESSSKEALLLMIKSFQDNVKGFLSEVSDDSVDSYDQARVVWILGEVSKIGKEVGSLNTALIEFIQNSNPTIGLDNGAWPMYCHDSQHTCRSQYKGLTEQPNDIKWVYSSPGGEGGITSSIAVGGDGTIYAGSGLNDKWISNKLLGYSGVLSAIFPNGKMKWTHDSYRGTPMISMIESSPLLTSDGKIIYGKDDGHVYALSKSGNLLWDFATDDPYNPRNADDNEQIIPSPVLGSDNTIYVLSHWGNVYIPHTIDTWNSDVVLREIIKKYNIKGVTKEPWGKLYAVDVLTGKRKWVLDFSKEIEKKVSFGSPALAKDGTIYISLYDDSYNGYLFAINKDGSMKWKFSKEGGSNIGALQASPSVGADGTIYVGSFGSKNKAKIYAINPDGSLKWSYKILENRITSGPGIGPDGTLYFGSHNFPYYPSSIANNDVKGHMYALRDLGFEGELKWKYEVDYGITASPAIDKDGNVFFATTKIGSSMPIRLLGDYQFYALNNRGQKLWSYPLKGYSWGSPSIGKDGTIYLGVMRGEAGVVAFGSSSEKCVESVWIPAVNTVCSNTAFTQTSNCENTRPASGTKICYTPSVTCPDIPCSSGYICEMREPREGGNQCTPNWFFGPPGGGR